jgi:hypothetical protein
MKLRNVLLITAMSLGVAGSANADDTRKDKAKAGAKKLLGELGKQWPKEKRAFAELPAKARKEIRRSFNEKLAGRTIVVVENGKKVEVTIGRFVDATRGGAELDCHAGSDAIGCWHASGTFTGCYVVGGEWECVWNEGIGDNDD